MAPQPLPQEEVDRIAALYAEAVAAGAVPIGSQIYTGRYSALSWIMDRTGLSRNQVELRVNMAARLGLLTDDTPGPWTYPRTLPFQVSSGTVLVGSDLHAWPGDPPLMWHVFVAVAELLRPAAIILNGDVIDGARVSRHPRLRRQATASIGREIETARSWIDMLPSGADRFWTVGNHDMRVNAYLANNAPELDDFAGDLSDRFQDWRFGYAVVVNGHTEIRHRFRSGIHAAWNNTLHGGCNLVTGHTHQLDVKAQVDRHGRRWGVECGMLADPNGPQFEFTEDAPRRWNAGFAVLSFDEHGAMQPPELCEFVHGAAYFRGQAIRPRIRVKAAHG